MDTLTKAIIEEVIKDLEIAQESSESRTKQQQETEYLHPMYIEIAYLRSTMAMSRVKLQGLLHLRPANESPAGNRDREIEEIQSEVNQGISLSKEAAFENEDIYLTASWSKKYFYGIEVTLKGTKDKKGENLTFFWDNDYWLYNLAIGDEEAIKSAREDLTEREATFVRVFLKNLVDRGILKGQEEEENTSSFNPPSSIKSEISVNGSLVQVEKQEQVATPFAMYSLDSDGYVVPTGTTAVYTQMPKQSIIGGDLKDREY